MTINSKAKAYFMLIGSMLIWGSLSVFVKAVSLTSSQIVLWRVLLGLLFLSCVFVIKKKKINKEALRKNVVRLLLTGAVMGFNWLALFESYRWTDVSIATLCYYSAPVIVCIGSVIFFKEHIGPIKLLSILSAVAGMIIISGVSTGNASSVKGILFGFASAVLYASVTLSNKGVKGMSGLEITIIQLVGAAMVMLPYVIFTTGIALPTNGAKEICSIIILGFVHTGVALYMYLDSIQHLKAQSVALCSYVDPVSALFFAYFVFHDRMTPIQILGAVLIIGGAVLGETLGNKALGKKSVSAE